MVFFVSPSFVQTLSFVASHSCTLYFYSTKNNALQKISGYTLSCMMQTDRSIQCFKFFC